MSAIATRKVLAQSFRFVGRNIRHVAAAALIPVVLYAALGTVVDLQSPNSSGSGRFIWPMLSVSLDLVFVPFYVAWHRLILLSGATVDSRTVSRAGARDLRYCGYLLVVLLPLYAFALGTASAIGRVPDGSWQGAHVGVTFAVVALAFAWLSVRFAFLLVETSIDRSTSPAAGWRSTRGHGGPLLVLFLATMAPKWLLHAVALAPLLALHGSEPSPAVTALLNVLWAVLTVVFGAVWVSAMSYAYRDATGYRPPDLETLF